MAVFFTILHVLVCFLLVVAVLLQSGKGSGLAASVGGGLSSSSFLGGRAATTFLTKATTILATTFLVLCLLLAIVYDEDTGTPITATERMLETQGAAPAATPAPFEPAPPEGSGEATEAPASALPQ